MLHFLAFLILLQMITFVLKAIANQEKSKLTPNVYVWTLEKTAGKLYREKGFPMPDVKTCIILRKNEVPAPTCIQLQDTSLKFFLLMDLS